MKINIVQTNIVWENPSKNRDAIEALLSLHHEKAELTILPEMFTTGFTMQPEKQAEEFKTTTYSWLKTMSNKHQTTFVGSIPSREQEQFFNRLHWIEPSGKEYFYDKRHLFRMAREDRHYKAGKDTIIIEINGWKIKPLICYDLRFPVWCRNVYNKVNDHWSYDVLLFVANWPEVRNYPWQQLLIARAIENQCYVIGVNRVGNDGNGIAHCGNSLVINPRGEIISQIPLNQEGIYTTEIDKTYLEEFRKIFPVGMDADDFELHC
jgi:predicted amidohydrolase